VYLSFLDIPMVQLSSKLCCVYFTFVGEENVGDTEWTAV